MFYSSIKHTLYYNPFNWVTGNAKVPAMTLSTAYSKLNVSMDLYPSLAACKAASLQMLAMSAPETQAHRLMYNNVLIGIIGGII